jgi:hypothetical protein
MNKDSSETIKYNVQSIVDALGWERARVFLDVKNTDLHTYFKIGIMNGGVTYEEIEKCKINSSKTWKAGGMMIKEKIIKKTLC